MHYSTVRRTTDSFKGAFLSCSLKMLRVPRWCDVQPLSEKDIGVIAASDIPAGSKFGPSHDIPNILVKAKEERKISYALKVIIDTGSINPVPAE